VGTTVELWLPVSERTTAETPASAASVAGSGRCYRILVVDDDLLIGAATAAMLEDLGHTVVEATSGARALDILRLGTKVDLVITDQAMPNMTGTELAWLIRQDWPRLPIVLATGYGDLPNSENPGVPRLSKPYRQEELAATIAAVFDGGRAGSDGNVISLEAMRRA